MLARLEQINGVESSFGNGSANVVRLALRPGADPGKVAEAARRILSEQVSDRVPVQLGGAEAAAALQREQWRDKSWIAEVGAEVRRSAEWRSFVRRWSALLLALLLACAALLGLLWWRRRAQRRADLQRPQPPLHLQRSRLQVRHR